MAAVTNLIGVWQTGALGRHRYIYVDRTDAGYAYGLPCTGLGEHIPGGRETRIRLTPDGQGIQRYRRREGWGGS